MTATARRIQEHHVVADVTPLALALAEAQEGLGLELVHGDPESDRPAYQADQVWIVSEWLAEKLTAAGERVIRAGSELYWARRGTTPCIHLDEVFLRIAREHANGERT